MLITIVQNFGIKEVGFFFKCIARKLEHHSLALPIVIMYDILKDFMLDDGVHCEREEYFYGY